MGKLMILVNHVSYEYVRFDDNNVKTTGDQALDDLTLEIEEGSFTCILGPNGSGKSTLAKLLNALYVPSKGNIMVLGMDTASEELTLRIRENVGMVFQNPDNQIISNVVEEDVAFGPENIGLPTREIVARVDEALKAVDMEDFRRKSPSQLSGGQKQRVAIAGIMAMRPRCIVFDESTAMLDPEGRKEVVKLAHRLNKEDGITVIYITHFMEEAVDADKVIVLNEGRIARGISGDLICGTPREIFTRVDELKRFHLTVPLVTQLAFELKKEGINLPPGIIKREEFVKSIKVLMKESGNAS